MKAARTRVLRSRNGRKLFLPLLTFLGVGTGSYVFGQEPDVRHEAASKADAVVHALLENDGSSPAFDFHRILPVTASASDELPDPSAVDPSAVDGDNKRVGDSPEFKRDTAIADNVDEFADEADAPNPLVVVPLEIPREDQVGQGLVAPFAHPDTGRMALGAVAGAYSAAPEMIGDFFGGSFLVVPSSSEEQPGGPESNSFFGSSVSLAGGDRRFKVAENVSPRPQDRLFLNFNHFENALVDTHGTSRSLDRFAFGLEKTFFGGLASIETRLPLVNGLESQQSSEITNNTGTELGNLALALKVNLLSGSNWLVSAGTSATLPTGDDFELFIDPNTRTLLIENDAVHLAPFLGWMVQPSGACFAQGFIQADFDLNGNDVLSDIGYEGVLQDQNLLFIDVSVGRWMTRSLDRSERLTGVAAIAELHYTTTMNDTDAVIGIANPHNRMDILNAAAAIHFQLRETSLRIGGSAPLRDDEESLFDAEFIFQFNRTY